MKKCLWMSFCDSQKPEGHQLLGVIITDCVDFIGAMMNINKLGINPGGQIQVAEVNKDDFDKNHFDVLLSMNDLKNAGYI